jgi:hypothetical protein
MTIERIKKLLGMTTARGCSEAEAMAAAAKAARLMAELGLRRGDIEMDREDVAVRRGTGSIRARLWGTIGVVTNCAPTVTTDDSGQSISFIGSEPAPSIAAYLYQVTDRAIDRELATFRSTTWYKRRRTLKAKRQASSDFTAAMIVRLSARLGELFASTMSTAAREAANAERDARFPTVVVAQPRIAAGRYNEAADAGYRSGGHVTLSHGVAGSTPSLAIGGRS